MLKKNTEFNWTKSREDAFNRLKEIWCETVPLKSFNSNSGTVRISCDTSSIGLGAVLERADANDKFYPIYFYSRKRLEREKAYSTGELEALSCLCAVQHFYIFVYERHFILRTDNSAVLTLLKNNLSKRTNYRIERWRVITLQPSI